MEGKNKRNYARCEWKCIASIGTMAGEKLATKQSVKTRFIASPQTTKPVPMNAIHCNGQRGHNLIEDDPSRP